MKKKSGFKRAFSGYFAFFSVIAVTETVVVLIYERVHDSYGDDKRAISAIMLAVCLGVSLLCTTIDALRRRFTVDKTVEDILNATERITSGDFKVRLAPRHVYNKYDDFDLIIENLNQMAEVLSKNEVLGSNFISNVSHEIKTPLAVIQNYATLLLSDKLSEEQRKNYLSILVQASNGLSDLVMNVLRLNKLENQKFLPDFAPVRLDEMLAQTVFGLENLIEKKSIELECDVDEVLLTSPSAYLEIVWNNLLSNAIKFTPSGGKIEISLKVDGKNAVVRFSDTGIGMNEETGRRIFDKFYQGDTSHAKEGNGLGLALVKRVIDLLGGSITVESELGKGTSFTVTLGGAELIKNETKEEKNYE